MKQFHDTSHHVPTEVIPFLEGLGKVVGEGKINFGKFVRSGAAVKSVEARNYDESKGMLHIRFNHREYMQTILLKIGVDEIKPVYDFVQSYKF